MTNGNTSKILHFVNELVIIKYCLVNENNQMINAYPCPVFTLGGKPKASLSERGAPFSSLQNGYRL